MPIITGSSVILNACKNILVVSQVMDRPLWKHVLRALYLEWGNPNCCVLMLRALIGDCIFRSVKSSPQEDGKKMKNMGTDIGKKKCMANLFIHYASNHHD